MIKDNIIINNFDILGGKTKKSSNYWYSKFSYGGKKYYQVTNNRHAYKSEYIIYY